MQEKLFDQSIENVLNTKPREGLKKSGLYRSRIVETNDPLNIGRVRIIIPEFHDSDIPFEYCPWAQSSPYIGGRGSFFFTAPTIGDFVFVSFEKGDPQHPIVVGFAPPLRRGNHSIQQVHTETAPVLNESGRAVKRSKDYESRYLPKDGRPMKVGYVDTYGNTDFSSAVGFFPKEHEIKPAPADLGGADGRSITRRTNPPTANDPDGKFMLRMTKYGNFMLMSDQGYWWKKTQEGENGEDQYGEFSGDREEDFNFEAKRWLSIQKAITENDPSSKDRRRNLMATRYGHIFDMRDTGWAQPGPVASKSRSGEYGPRAYLSRETERDQRFVRLRTKGGALLFLGDKGAHPEEDKFIKKPLFKDLQDQEKEMEKYWGGDKDARFTMLMTRYGWKFLLDDRGSDPRKADKRDTPRGMGMLLKGRRRAGTTSGGLESPNESKSFGKPRGFYLQVVESDDLNSMMMGSPMGHAIEMSDKYQYTMIATTMGRKWSKLWKGFKDHEYVEKPLMSKNPEKSSHHIKLDHSNEYIRFKTRGGRGRRPVDGVQPGVGKRELQQGFEARDGNEDDGPWVELVDCQHRGVWLSKKEGLTILRGKKRKKLYIWIDDKSKEITIYGGDPGSKINLYSRGSINLKSDRDVNIEAGRILNFKGKQIRMQSTRGAKFTLAKNIFSNARINANRFNGFLPGAMPGPGAQKSQNVGQSVDSIEKPEVPTKIEPEDRGKTYNGPFTGLSQESLSPKVQT